MPINAAKRRYLAYELGLLSIEGALSTRNRHWPVYSCAAHARAEAKSTIRETLEALVPAYRQERVTDAVHSANIVHVAHTLTERLRAVLHQRRFRIGVAQKLVNLHLKYLWTAGMIEEPPHCPIDGIVRDYADIGYDWTSSNSIDQYLAAIAALRNLAQPRSLAVWELQEFRRRADREA